MAMFNSKAPKLTVFFLIWIVTHGIHHHHQHRQQTKIEKNDFMTKEAIKWTNETAPFELLDPYERRKLSDEMLLQFRSTLSGVTFSGVFGDNAVLQREPYLSALYGACDTPHAAISLAITQLDGNYQATLFTTSDDNGDWKIILNTARPNGGNYTVNVSCDTCAPTSTNAAYDVLYNVTFGDVYYCAGQSNMELDMRFTFSRNITYQAITDGAYRNIRYKTQNEIDTTNVTYVIPRQTAPQYAWQPVRDEITNISLDYSLDKFSAACWYFAQSLTEMYDDLNDTVMGLIDVSVGGTMIEQWIENKTVQLECKDSLCPDMACGGLYNGLVATYLNMTVKGYLWYQGENNVYEEPGSWLNYTGYGCMQPFMLKQWRSQWSVIPQTSSPVTPFGLVTLAGGTSEGHGPNMGRFRWAQMGNFDYLPNTQLVNTFAAQAHDTGDPWNKECFYLDPPRCQGNAPYSWNKTNFYMGPIHPRLKRIVGRRLAQSGYPILYKGAAAASHIGPTLAGCIADNVTQEISILFNRVLGKVSVQPFVAWYNTSINYTNVGGWTALEVEINRVWYLVDNIRASAADSNVVIANVSQFNVSVISGVRYAWSDYPCCGDLDRNYNPCPPDSCPIKSVLGSNTLPAIPFWAQIVNGTCDCFEPQTCDAYHV